MRKGNPGGELDGGAEAEIIVRAVCATKLPTLTFEDTRRFRALLGAAQALWILVPCCLRSALTAQGRVQGSHPRHSSRHGRDAGRCARDCARCR